MFWVKIIFCLVSLCFLIAFVAICKNMESADSHTKKRFNLLGDLGLIVICVTVIIGFIDILFL